MRRPRPYAQRISPSVARVAHVVCIPGNSMIHHIILERSKPLQKEKSERPSRRSLRLPSYDYSTDGAYFITICHYRRQPILKEPVITAILEENWFALPGRFPGISLDEFIIMPDHVHFILWQKASNVILGRSVGAFKSLTGRFALEFLRSQGRTADQHFWQRDYFEHVIRNDEDLALTREYIRNNPLKALLLQEEWHRERHISQRMRTGK